MNAPKKPGTDLRALKARLAKKAGDVVAAPAPVAARVPVAAHYDIPVPGEMASPAPNSIAFAFSIKVFYGDQLVDTQTLSQNVIKIGKLKSSHVCLDDEAVARMHAVIEVSGEEVRVIDLGSATGTTLNAGRVDKNAMLRDGDQLTFGPYRLEVGFVRLAATVGAAPVAAAPMAAAVAPMMHRAPIQIDVSEFEIQNGSRVAEVVATYGNTVLDVQHVGQLKNRRLQAPVFLAFGGLMLIAGSWIFLSEVGKDWKSYQRKLDRAHETGDVRPPKPGNGLTGYGAGLVLLGLLPFCMGLIRLGDYVNRSYTIGESHGASFHVPPQGLPDGAAFPLVRGSDHEFALNFTQQMQGEVTFDGQSIPLGQLVSSGRAGSQGSSYTFPLPPGANCRVKYNDLTFFVNSVAPGAVIKGGGDTDKPFWFYNGASATVLGSLFVLTHLIRPEAGVTEREPAGQGALDGKWIQSSDHRHVDEVRDCYHQALTRKVDAKGDLWVRFTIDGTGRVLNPVAVSVTTMNDAAFDSCIRMAVYRWRFPEQGGGAVNVVNYFVLDPGWGPG